MDPDLVLFSQSAGTVLTTLLADDAYARAKTAVVALCRRVVPGRAAQVEADLEASRTQLLEARDAGDDARSQQVAEAWQQWLSPILATYPEELTALHAALREAAVEAATIEGPKIGSLRMTAKVKGHGRSYQAGRDLHTGER